MPTLLAVDDSIEVLAMRAAVFTDLGFTVITCETPRQALAYLHGHTVDLIVTDYKMPQIDGLCLAKQARANGYKGPIVMATATDNLSGIGLKWIDQMVLKGGRPQALTEVVLGYIRPGCNGCRSKLADRSSRCAA